MPVYLIRHGQSRYNVEDRFGGDSGLTEKGRKDAGRAAAVLDGETINTVYCSPTQRTRETADILLKKHPEARLEPADELREISYGVLEGTVVGELKKQQPQMHEERKEDKYLFKPPDGENYQDLQARVIPFYEQVAGQEGTYVLVTHQAVIRTLVAHVTNIPDQIFPYLDLPNDLAYLITEDTVLYYRGGWRTFTHHEFR